MTSLLWHQKRSLQKPVVTCCGTCLNKSRRATSSFRINRSRLCSMPVAGPSVELRASRTSKSQSTCCGVAGEHNDSTVGKRSHTYLSNSTSCTPARSTQVSIPVQIASTSRCAYWVIYGIPAISKTRAHNTLIVPRSVYALHGLYVSAWRVDLGQRAHSAVRVFPRKCDRNMGCAALTHCLPS